MMVVVVGGGGRLPRRTGGRVGRHGARSKQKGETSDEFEWSRDALGRARAANWLWVAERAAESARVECRGWLASTRWPGVPRTL